MSATPTDTLVIVAKYPEPGMVKTRLGAVIGASRAAALYSAFLRDLAARFDTPDAPWVVRWAVAPGAQPPATLRAIVGPRAHVFSQRGEDFAARLYHICEDTRGLGAQRLAIISSDAPQIGTELISEAFAAVMEANQPADESAPKGLAATKPAFAGWDVAADAFPSRIGPAHPHETRPPHVSPSPRGRGGRGVRSAPSIAISPAEDGGYSLIALRLSDPPAAPPDLFRGITMSTATVLAETEARAAALGLRVARLEPTFDVDEAADLGRLWLALRAAPSLAPRTYAALAGLIAAPIDRNHSGNEDMHGDIASYW